MHGQYDWMRDEAEFTVFEWDTMSPAEQWRPLAQLHAHTYTNIVDKDRDIGYGICAWTRRRSGTRTTWATPSTPRC